MVEVFKIPQDSSVGKLIFVCNKIKGRKSGGINRKKKQLNNTQRSKTPRPLRSPTRCSLSSRTVYPIMPVTRDNEEIIVHTLVGLKETRN